MVTQLVNHMTAAADQRDAEIRDSETRWLNLNRVFIDGLIFNTQNRTSKHNPGVKKAGLAEILHTMTYDETYFDVFEGEDKDYKVRVFFEPLIRLFKGNKKAVLPELKLALDRHFPIPPDQNFEWNPIWKTVPYKPKLKSDKRTKRLTVQFNWSVKKTA